MLEGQSHEHQRKTPDILNKKISRRSAIKAAIAGLMARQIGKPDTTSAKTPPYSNPLPTQVTSQTTEPHQRRMDQQDIQDKNRELIDKLTNEFGLVIVPTEVPEELTTPWLESFYTAFSKYRTLGLTNFSNIQTGPLHLLINNSGTMMNEQPLFPDKDPRGYAWNSPEYNQLVIKQPIDTSTDILTKEYRQYVAHHEPGHILQYQLFPGFEDFNALSSILEAEALQAFQELGYHIVSPSSLFGKKPPWELAYDLSQAPEVGEKNSPEVDSMYYIWSSGNPFIEGTNTCLTEYVLRPEQFQALYPQHFAWTEQRYIPLLRKQLERLKRG